MAVQKKNITVDEFEQFINLPENDNRRFELIEGEIVEKVPTEEHALIAIIIGGEIYIYLKQNRIGRVTVEPRHGLPQDDQNDYIPDVAFTRNERLLPLVKEGAVPQMPDLAIEIKSPNDSLPKMRRKAAYYLENGSQAVWLVFPNLQQIEVHTSEASVNVLGINDTLDGGNLLPGFTLAVKDIFTTS